MKSPERSGPKQVLRLEVYSAGLLVAFVAWCVTLTAIGTHDHLARADLIVVPATSVEPGGTPSPRLRARCDRAAAVFHAGLAPAVFVSGGVDQRGHDEAACMKRYLVARGVPSAAVVTDSLGTDSWLTALHARAWLGAHRMHRVLIVSQGFHVPRLRLAFRRLGVANVYWTHADFWEPRDVFSLARELPGLVKYAFRLAPP